MRTRSKWLSGLAGITMLAGFSAHAADLEITLTDVKSGEGNIRLVLFDSESNFQKKPARAVSLPATQGDMSIKIADLPEGEYAVMLFQDIDGNEELNTNLFRMPSEPWGASLNGRPVFGPPDWKGTRFEVTETGAQISIKLR